MIELPDPGRAWEYENGFYLTCGTPRISKLLAQYELYKRVLEIPGVIVECGVFKGASLSRLAMFRHLFETADARQIVAFDTFDRFPDTEYEADRAPREAFVTAGGAHSISVDQMRSVLEQKDCGGNIELVAGDIRETVPAYVAAHPELKIALLNLDTDVYEPARVILDHLYPRLSRGGIVILDDYAVFPGETAAVDAFFAEMDVTIHKFPFGKTPSYAVKS